MEEERLIGYIDNSEEKKLLVSSGWDFSQKERRGSFFQQDDKVVFSTSFSDSVDILGKEEALKYPEFREYLGKSFRFLQQKVPENTKGGYFIRVKKGRRVDLPIQTCFFLKRQKFNQRVHNVVVVEEEAEVYLITGCVSSQAAGESLHLGVSEFFIKKGGYLNFTMIHSWQKDIIVQPVSVALLEEGANFVSSYICLKPVRRVSMYPTAVLRGEKGRASFTSLVLSYPDTLQDVGTRVLLKAKHTQTEVISRTASLGGKVIARAHLKAESEAVTAHLECRGLILSEKGVVHAIPELETEWRDVKLSHEAAIGRINKEEIEYLRSRGFSLQQAQSIIVRGFMDIDTLGLPASLKKELQRLEEEIFSEKS